eukprot:13819380-Alexandrium_andersonii.AAC.1
MVLALHALPNDVVGFAESCCCHEPVLKGKSVYQRALALKDDYGSSAPPGLQSCVMAGMRAP